MIKTETLPNREPLRLYTIDALRGFAAFIVCWYHIAASGSLLDSGVFYESAKFGWLGVDVFFVISGFVIPYAMWRAGYQINDFGRFFLKRMCRIEPPYIAAIGLVVILWEISGLVPGFQGHKFQWDWLQIGLHFGYLNAFVGLPWLNSVFWTLAIEFQYYLLMGITFPLLVSGSGPVRLLTGLALLLVASAISTVQTPTFQVHAQNPYVFNWMALFLLGMVTFQFKVGLQSRSHYLILVGGLGLAAWFMIGPLSAVVGVATGLVIAFVYLRNRVMTFLGTISYSLYLTHSPIGGRVDNFFGRYAHNNFQKVPCVLLAVVVAIGFATIFHWLIERPAMRFAGRLSYKKPAQP